MHQICFPLGRLQRSLRPHNCIYGTDRPLKGGKGRESGGEDGGKGKVKGRGGDGGSDLVHPKNFSVAPPMS